jgi:hypothetical protein
VNGQIPRKAEYDLKSVKLAYLSGLSLRLFLLMLKSPLRRLLISNMIRESGIAWLRKLMIDEKPTFYPMFFTKTPAAERPG